MPGRPSGALPQHCGLGSIQNSPCIYKPGWIGCRSNAGKVAYLLHLHSEVQGCQLVSVNQDDPPGTYIKKPSKLDITSCCSTQHQVLLPAYASPACQVLALRNDAMLPHCPGPSTAAVEGVGEVPLPEDWDAGTLVHLRHRTPAGALVDTKVLPVGDSIVAHWSGDATGAAIHSVDVATAKFLTADMAGPAAFVSAEFPALVALLLPGVEAAVTVCPGRKNSSPKTKARHTCLEGRHMAADRTAVCTTHDSDKTARHNFAAAGPCQAGSAGSTATSGSSRRHAARRGARSCARSTPCGHFGWCRRPAPSRRAAAGAARGSAAADGG